LKFGNTIIMSRLGKNPITIPANITVDFKDNVMVIKGPKGELSRTFTNHVTIEVTADTVTVTPVKDDVFSRSLWGTVASHVTNMFVGVTEGYQKVLEVEGVGYRWTLQGDTIEMSLGFSHPVIMPVPKGITVEIEKSTMKISGIDKELVGSFTADIRAKKKPEPYKGKGIRYQGEHIRRKQGKRAA